ncbi:TauD/TfdA family dioxygenase [Singulisphaera acidiphila]|uniref:Putative taurine catabolism dioxygenase n=1 Tax=Singulisphaera acidiphila (strain ATCC BAA-1392 / DSM 18658 / VKM B-2454 / MOB10) TaxID=886293 RepID=L0DQ18_SINAD|nr:TauD/TfdA family dioxygenase [Singulisphaera acidiphila]AGA30786.1 putative taurine catabolism dioxygenase [Singulisphaera acidiphila DSM 18658]
MSEPTFPEIATDPRAWRKADVGPETSWRLPFPPELAGALVALARGGTSVIETQLDEADRLAWAPAFAGVLDDLERGRGFAIVEGPVGVELSPEARCALYWVVGQLLGHPVIQNVEGVRLYDVRDTGRTIGEGARFSVTNAESTFHTDASFEDEVVDYVGLLCLSPAKSGGLGQLVSGYTVHDELATAASKSLQTLAGAFQVDRRGGLRPGESPTALRPVIAKDERGGLIYRYLRTWIEVGHDKAGEPLSPAQTEALDALDRVLNRPELRVEFRLQPGDMFFANNRWTLHNRTAFEDHPDPERRRHYVRLWLSAHTGHLTSVD